MSGKDTESLATGGKITLVKAEKLSLWANSSVGMDQGMIVIEYQDWPKIIDIHKEGELSSWVYNTNKVNKPSSM